MKSPNFFKIQNNCLKVLECIHIIDVHAIGFGLDVLVYILSDNGGQSQNWILLHTYFLCTAKLLFSSSSSMSDDDTSFQNICVTVTCIDLL